MTAVDYMARALSLASLALGRTAPNPAVGAVLVRDGRIVGEGYTRPPGGHHAEVVALQQAGPLARGATLYVTLEPCCHHGRTPPCTAALIAAGVAEVRMATIDPNPRVRCRGRESLQAAGIVTSIGEREAEARELIEGFDRWVSGRRPFVTAKWAMTLDGKIATTTGHSRWITGEAARARVHDLRDAHDAIMVGANTVLADDPLLTVRLGVSGLRPPRPRPPLRVIADSRGRTPLGAKILQPDLAPGTIVATTEQSTAAWRAAVEERGARVLVLPEEDGRVGLDALLAALAGLDVTTVLVEGGGQLLGSLFAGRLVDKVYAFVAPKIVGGAGAPTPVAGPGVATADQAWPIEVQRVERVGEDLLVVGYVVKR